MALALQATLGLYDFMEGSAGVGTISSICKPALPLDDEDGFTLVKSWIENAKVLSIMWPHSSSNKNEPSDVLVCPTVYEPQCSPDETILRAARLIMISDDKDVLRKRALEISKEKRTRLATSIVNNRAAPGSRRQLDYNSGSQDSRQQSEESSPMGIKRPLGDDEESIAALRSKVARLENDAKAHSSEIENLKGLLQQQDQQLREQDKELDAISSELADRENEVMDLKEKLENQDVADGNPLQLVQELNKSLGTLKGIIETQSKLPSGGFHTPPPSRPGSASKEMMKLKGDILIEKDVVTSAIASARKNGDTKRSLNAFVGALMSSFWRTDELAALCLTGTACPNKPGAPPKEQFPEEYLQALIHFTIRSWKDIYEHARVNDLDVRAAVTAKLLNSHTAQKRAQERIQKHGGNESRSSPADGDGRAGENNGARSNSASRDTAGGNSDEEGNNSG